MAQSRFSTSLRADFQAGEVLGSGTVSNVSEGGLFIETPSVPELGDSVELTLSAPDGAALQLCGMVWWTTDDTTRRHSRPGFALRLLDESDDWAKLIDTLA